MSTRTPDSDLPVRRIDRILVFMGLGLTALSIACFFAGLIARAVGADLTTGIWPVVGLLPLLALPVAFLLIVSVLVMSFVRRARANKGR
jgi:hypothetical protein